MSNELAAANARLRIAVLDDDPRICTTIGVFLKPLQCDVATFTDPDVFIKSLSASAPDILIADLRMPKIDGITVLKIVREVSPDTEVIIVSGNAEKHHAIQALKLGAYDFFEKPVDRLEMLETVKRTVRYRDLLRDRNRVAGQLSFVTSQEAKRWCIDALIGKSAAMRKVIHDIQLLQRAANTSVLITGESGTGKELIARAIHYGSARASRPFVPINCSAIPTELAESTFFGHVKGAFTGALADRPGCFETAHEGTLFLDEIGDMPAAMQIKLLRVLEDGIITPVGKTTGRPVNVRVIAVTNADLEARIAAGTFRADLFYRIAAFNFTLPPLRERTADIPLLVEHFVHLFAGEMGISPPAIAPEASSLLERYAFPGNIRELKNMIERALIESAGETIAAEHIHFILKQTPPVARKTSTTEPEKPVQDVAPADLDAANASLPLNIRDAEIYLIRKAVANSCGNMAKAARSLGISRPKLYRKLAGIIPEKA